MRREAFVRWPVHGNVLEALREGRLEVGAGALLEPDVWITAPGSARVRIGAGTFLNLGVMVAAQELVEIGDHCMLANGCFVSDASHRYDDPEQPITWQGFESKGPTRIGDNCWLGANVVVTSGVTHRRALRDRREQRRHARHRAALGRRRRAGEGDRTDRVRPRHPRAGCARRARGVSATERLRSSTGDLAPRGGPGSAAPASVEMRQMFGGRHRART